MTTTITEDVVIIITDMTTVTTIGTIVDVAGATLNVPMEEEEADTSTITGRSITMTTEGGTMTRTEGDRGTVVEAEVLKTTTP